MAGSNGVFCGSRSDVGPALSREAFVGVSPATFGVLLGQSSFAPSSSILDPSRGWLMSPSRRWQLSRDMEITRVGQSLPGRINL